MMKVKYYCAALAIAVLIGSLIGCGNENKKAEDLSEESKENNKPEMTAAQLMAKGMNTDGFSYEYVLTMPNGDKSTYKMWVKEGNMRSEMDNPAGGEPILSIVNNEDKMVYVYQPELNQAIAMPMQDSQVDTTSPKDYLSETDSENMMYLNRENFDGKSCLVYETNVGGIQSKMWIWEEFGMPLRVETQSGEDKIVVEFLNVKIGNIDESVFQLPEGTTIMNMSEFMQP